MKKFQLEQKIMHRLMLETHFLKDISIISGKMGIILALAEYQKLKFNPVYEEFMYDIIDDILLEIHKELPVGLSNGLCGIGYGIEYLLQNNFIEGQSIEICEEIDQKIMEVDIKRIRDMSFSTGIEGILYYILVHIKGALLQKSTLPFDTAYLQDVHLLLHKLDNYQATTNMKFLIEQFKNFHTMHSEPRVKLLLDKFIKEDSVNNDNLNHCPLGLNGLAGKIVKQTF